MPEFELPIGEGIDAGVAFVQDHFQPGLDAIAAVVDGVGGTIDQLLLAVPVPVFIGLVGVLAVWRLGIGFGLFTLASLALIASMKLWEPTLATVGLVLSSTVFSLVVGVPLGIVMSRNETIENVTRTILDFMQTMPAFVYLIPAVMFFGLGRVPGILATVIFAMPPAVRLTALGIRQVPLEMVEAARAFGCTDRQLLLRVQLPNALPSIMAGINQTLMLALSMIVIASMIGAGGLGNVVLQGIQRLDAGLGFKSGLSVVMVAIILDRLTQSLARRHEGKPSRSAQVRRWLGKRARNT